MNETFSYHLISAHRYFLRTKIPELLTIQEYLFAARKITKLSSGHDNPLT